jgi:divalent metal cation (Fe/Co/Zn/Cd) transporter
MFCAKNSVVTKAGAAKSKNIATSAVAFTGMIVHLISVSHLQLDPGIATCIALYVNKVELNIFCEHITPNDRSK